MSSTSTSHRRQRLLALCLGGVVVSITGAAVGQTPDAAPTPLFPADDFSVQTVAEGLSQPVSLAVAPDGRIFVTEKTGAVRVIENGVLVPEPFAEIEVFEGGESGLLGIALDPNFTENRYLYLFASVSAQEQHIIRFTDQQNLGISRVVIRDNLPTSGTIHTGGALVFGPEGMLYFGIGDNGERENAQFLTSLAGKVCRLSPDGAVPADNPFTTPTGAPRAIYATGLRNPFRMTFASDGRLFVMDVGSSGDERREEVNIVRAGDNCGWPIFEGASGLGAASPYREPALAYDEPGGAAITGAVMFEQGPYPELLRNRLLHLEFVQNRLYAVEFDGDAAVSHEVVVQLSGGLVDLVQDLDGTLLFTEIETGRIQRLVYSGSEPLATQAQVVDEDAADADTNSANDDEAVTPNPLAGVALGCGALPLTLLFGAFAFESRRAYVRHRATKC